MPRTNVLYIPNPADPPEATAKRFHKKVVTAGVFKEMKVRVFYEQPSVRKRRKQAAARKRFRKDHAPNGELLWRLERERVLYPQDRD